MRLSLLTAGAASALLLFQVPVMAQSNTNQHNGGATAEQSVNPATGSPSAAGMSAHGSIRTQLQSMLQNQGFSDVRSSCRVLFLSAQKTRTVIQS